MASAIRKAGDNVSVPIDEQETVIQIDRQTGIAKIYTSDARIKTRLDKIYDRTCVHRMAGRIVAVEYQVPESLISYRKGSTNRRPLTPAEKKRRADLLKSNLAKTRVRKKADVDSE